MFRVSFSERTTNNYVLEQVNVGADDLIVNEVKRRNLS